ncbi:MAG: hypothetical protein COV45_00730 [Deltaproteobacteria bacterium CG11_big_fil_rev_8_21_14_0_20_47_16]|nr:MAG: hypothetical protein COV45_00730 [Deltaproteobacteria bacterium CG11_big_fil_rev_8_21_14_0_20_47_16]
MTAEIDFHVVLTWISNAIAGIGVAVITLGALVSLFGYLRSFFKVGGAQGINLMRTEIGRSIMLGLEFIVAADVIKTIVTPDYYSLGILGGLTAIRIVLSYFLNQEIQTIMKAK